MKTYCICRELCSNVHQKVNSLKRKIMEIFLSVGCDDLLSDLSSSFTYFFFGNNLVEGLAEFLNLSIIDYKIFCG